MHHRLALVCSLMFVGCQDAVISEPTFRGDDAGGDPGPAGDDDEPIIPAVLSSGTWVASHDDCDAGAAVFTSGLDVDGDGTLDDEEISSTTFVCGEVVACTVETGEDDITVTCPGLAPVVVTKPLADAAMLVSITAADSCPNGGYVITSGHDDGALARNGTLETDEIEDTQELCAPYCGDEHTDVGEACDDGNDDPDDACDACVLVPDCLPPDPDPTCPPADYHVDYVTPLNAPTTGNVTATFVGVFPENGSLANTTLKQMPANVSVTVDSVTPTVVTFTLPPGAGEAQFALEIAGVDIPYLTKDVTSHGVFQVGLLPEIPLRFETPVITSVAGCSNDSGGVTAGCPTTGAIPLTITGTGFGPVGTEVIVSIGGAPCPGVILSTPHTTLTCNLPSLSGGGYDLPVRVYVAGYASDPVAALSYAGPSIVPGTLREQGSSPADPVALSDTNAGHILEFEATGADVGGISIHYGPPGHALFPCTSPQLTGEVVSCTTSQALGTDLHIVLTVAGVASRPSAESVTYPAPLIRPGSLRATRADMGTGGAFLGSASQNDTVYFDVENVFFRAVTPPLVTASYGPYPCEALVVHDGVPYATVECRTSLGWGGPYNFQVTGLNQTSAPGDDEFTYPLTPIITALSGCPVVVGPSTAGCNTEGGQQLTVHGSGFVDPIDVTVGSVPCANPRILSSGTRIYCDLPPGVGKAAVVVAVGSVQSPPAPLFTYGTPFIERISGCAENIGVSTVCPTEGGPTLSIVGKNFGAEGGTVFVGGQSCDDVTHAVDDPHHRLFCTVPPGSGTNVPVYVLNGEPSPQPFYLSYDD